MYTNEPQATATAGVRGSVVSMKKVHTPVGMSSKGVSKVNSVPVTTTVSTFYKPHYNIIVTCMAMLNGQR